MNIYHRLDSFAFNQMVNTRTLLLSLYNAASIVWGHTHFSMINGNFQSHTSAIAVAHISSGELGLRRQISVRR